MNDTLKSTQIRNIFHCVYEVFSVISTAYRYLMFITTERLQNKCECIDACTLRLARLSQTLHVELYRLK